MRLTHWHLQSCVIQFFLTDKQYYITMHNYKSPTVLLKHGVPQGSVLWPLLFINYIMPLRQITRRHVFQYHCYAHDIHIYTACRPYISIVMRQRVKDLAKLQFYLFEFD